VSTVPLPYVPRLMPHLSASVLAQYASVDNIAVVCVIVKLRKPLSVNFWVNTNDPSMDIPGLVEYTNLRPLVGSASGDRQHMTQHIAQHIVYVPFYMPGEHPKFAEADAVFLDKVRRYLQTINPALSDADFLDMRASRYRHAQPICDPQFLRKLPPPAVPGVQGLWVADTSFYYPEDRGISESIGFGRKLAQTVVAG
jgi:protoporphyrinogen oxidase